MSQLADNNMPSIEESIIDKINQVENMAYEVALKHNLTGLLLIACKEEIDAEMDGAALRLLMNTDLSKDRTYRELAHLDQANREDKVQQIISIGKEASNDGETHHFQEVTSDLIDFLDMKMSILEAALTKSSNS